MSVLHRESVEGGDLEGALFFQEGDRIGLMRKTNGSLHYYINGMDQGVAATTTPQVVWGVVDLYGMAVKVSILDGGNPTYEPETIGRRTNNFLRQFPDDLEEDLLTQSSSGTYASCTK